MLSVSELQQGFIKDIFRLKGEELLDAFACDDKAEITERFNVYRQAVLNNLADALAIVFPGIGHLIGHQRARFAAFSFVHQFDNLPQYGCLNYWGAGFPRFLKQYSPASHLPYIEDYALLDWYCHLAHFASVKHSIDYHQISQINQNNADNCYFTFNKGVYFLHSKYPLEKIQHLINNPESSGFDLTFEPIYGIIHNSSNGVNILWLKQNIWLCLYKLYKKSSLADAFKDAKLQEEELSDLLILSAAQNLVKGLDFRDEG